MLIVKRTLVCDICENAYCQDITDKVASEIRSEANTKDWQCNCLEDICPSCLQKRKNNPNKAIFVYNVNTKEQVLFFTQIKASKHIGVTRQAVSMAIHRKSLLRNTYKVSKESFI